MATIEIDGRQHRVEDGDNLLHACLSLGLDLPYFCWHPALGSVGACRQCAVKQYRDASDASGRIVMACMTPVAEGARISVADAEAVDFRRSVIEWLMTHHPHDCPVCPEGGHCHLQDMTVMTGHFRRRYRFTKRTHLNQDLGPFIQHEMNRCIACYRCVRYYKDYAGGTDLGVFGSAANVYFGRPCSGRLESEFAGNLIEVCPTGVFTDKTHDERYNRRWDMQFAPSICQGCSLGCNISPGERYGELRRVENRYHGEINHYFLCDRGRFGHGFVNRPDRPRRALLRQDGQMVAVEPEVALAHATTLLKSARGVIGIGSPRASLEAGFALRTLVGAQNFHDGHASHEHALLGRALQILRAPGLTVATLRGIEKADAALVLGEDVLNTAPRVALALRRAAAGRARELAAARHVASWDAEAVASIGQHARHPVFVASSDVTRIDDFAAGTLQAAPDDVARAGFAIAHAIDPQAPAVPALEQTGARWAATVAESLVHADRPLIVCGTGAGSLAVLEAAANVALALVHRGKHPQICLVVPEVNSFGSALLAEGTGGDLDAALQRIERGEVDTVVVLENDLYRRADRGRVDALLARVRLLAIDHQTHATAARADVVLPGGSFAESDGTVVSNEGRAQRYFQVYDPAYHDPASAIREPWAWLTELHTRVHGQAPGWSHFDGITAALAQAIPALLGITAAAPTAQYRIHGLKVAREPPRYSGRTAMRANLSVHEPRQPQDADTALAFSMEGYNPALAGEAPGSLIPYAWAPGWSSPQAWNKFQVEVGGPLRGGDAGVRLLEGAGAAPLAYFTSIPAAFRPRELEWTVIPLSHIFGSEELTARAAALADLVPAPYIALNPADARRLGAREGSQLEVALAGATFTAPVTLRPRLPQGTAGLPAGVPHMPWFMPSARARLRATEGA